MAGHLDKGYFGEQGAGFFFGAQGYFLVDGPSGAKGHAANEPGFDGIAYCIARDDLILYDNKAFKSDRNVGTGTAIDPAANLTKNLNSMITHVQNMRDLPAKARITDLLQQTRNAIANKSVRPPPNVRIAITNFGGNSAGITAKFAGRGITFIDVNSVPAVPPRPSRTYINRQTIRSIAQPVSTGSSAWQARNARGAAFAEAVRFGAQTLNDHALQAGINRELERLTFEIGTALAEGKGALAVVNIDAASPPGNVSMVKARSVKNAYLQVHRNTNGKEAILEWDTRPKMEQGLPRHIEREVRLFWFGPP